MAYNRKPVVFDLPPSVVRTATDTVALADAAGRVSRGSVSPSDFNKLLGDALGNLGASTRAAAAAFRTLNEEFGPPEEIVELAERRSAELGITVSCDRIVGQGQLVWRVVVRTRRGSAQCEPFLSDKQGLELPEDLALVTAWKNAFTQLGLL